jgi:hypothetical protein
MVLINIVCKSSTFMRLHEADKVIEEVFGKGEIRFCDVAFIVEIVLPADCELRVRHVVDVLGFQHVPEGGLGGFNCKEGDWFVLKHRYEPVIDVHEYTGEASMSFREAN